MSNRLSLTLVAVVILIALSAANAVWYSQRMICWQDAALKDPHSVCWPGSIAILIVQYHSLIRTHLVAEAVLLLAFAIAIALIVRFVPPLSSSPTTPRASPADMQA